MAVLICMPLPPEYKGKLLRQKEAASIAGAAVDVEVPPVEFGLATIPLTEGQAGDEETRQGPASIDLSSNTT